MAVDPSSRRGHATRPHTADVTIEAWAPTPAACYEEAVAAFVEVFADIAGGTAQRRRVPFELGPAGRADLLVLLLEEVLAAVDIGEGVPEGAQVLVAGDRLAGTFMVVPIDAVSQIGPIPKGVSWSGLRFEPDDRGTWRCHATVDV